MTAELWLKWGFTYIVMILDLENPFCLERGYLIAMAPQLHIIGGLNGENVGKCLMKTLPEFELAS